MQPLRFLVRRAPAPIAEVSLREVDPGLIEPAQAAGCRRWHIVRHLLLPESLPGLIGGFTVTLMTMIGASAVATSASTPP